MVNKRFKIVLDFRICSHLPKIAISFGLNIRSHKRKVPVISFRAPESSQNVGDNSRRTENEIRRNSFALFLHSTM